MLEIFFNCHLRNYGLTTSLGFNITARSNPRLIFMSHCFKCFCRKFAVGVINLIQDIYHFFGHLRNLLFLRNGESIPTMYFEFMKNLWDNWAMCPCLHLLTK